MRQKQKRLVHADSFLHAQIQGCRNGRLENGVFVPCQILVVLTKVGEDSDSAFDPQNQGFAPQTPEIDDNDKNGGCHPRKMTVCQKHRFDSPNK